jgi:hypothetical protein
MRFSMAAILVWAPSVLACSNTDHVPTEHPLPSDAGTGTTTCTNTSTDPDNCGACKRSCLGGECKAGICAPTLLWTSAEASTATTTVRGVVSIAVNDSSVVWVHSVLGPNAFVTVTAIPKDGSAPARSTQPVLTDYGMASVYTSPQGYWLYTDISSEPGANLVDPASMAVTPSGSAGPANSLSLAALFDQKWLVSTTSDSLFGWVHISTPDHAYADSTFVDTQKFMAEVLAANASSFVLIGHESGSAAVWSIDRATVVAEASAPKPVGKLIFSGSSAAALWSPVGAVASAKSVLVWSNVRVDYSQPPSFAQDPTIYRVDLASGGVSVATPDPCVDLAATPLLEGDLVYWAGRTPSGGAIFQMPLAGASPQTVATFPDAPQAFAMDATAFYWGDQSHVWRLAR